MWKVEEQEQRKRARQQQIQREHARLCARHVPIDLRDRLCDAMKHTGKNYEFKLKRFSMPPRESFCRDSRGLSLQEEINLEELDLSNDWLAEIAGHVTPQRGTKKVIGPTKFLLAGTSVTDHGFIHLSKFKHLLVLDISRCHALTDESLSIIRRQLNTLEQLHINDCRHFTSDVLCQLWRDCTRLHSLSARGCLGVTDTLLRSIATTKRSGGHTLRLLDIRQCKHVSSAGISYLAASSIKEMVVHSLSIGDCMEVDNMAFFGFETSLVLTQLQVLNACRLSIDETAVSWIAKGCPALRRLNLSRCKGLTDFALLLLAPLAASPTSMLEWLNLKECSLITDTGIQNLFSVVKELERSKGVDDETIEDICTSRLTSLNLKNCTLIGDQAVKHIGEFCPKLLKLNLRGLRRVSDQGIIYIAKDCPSLATFKLSGRNITSQTFKLLGKMCRDLKVLDISERQDLETPECMLYLVSSQSLTIAAGSSLRKIDLHATNVCDTGVSILALNCPKLEWINLSKCPRVTDVAVEAIAACCYFLNVLLLSHARAITDKSLIACAMMHLPLQTVDLCGNTNITDTGLQTLCSGCQQIQTLHLKGCDRLSTKGAKHCNAILPFTKPMEVLSFSKTMAHGGGNTTLLLQSLPARHIKLLRVFLSRHQSVLILQGRFRKWKFQYFLMRRRRVRQGRAARKIQGCIRRFLEWKRYLKRLAQEPYRSKIIFVQACIRGNQSRHRTRIFIFTEKRAARRIQRAYRPHFRMRMCIRNANALTIQRVYRGFVGRKMFRCRLYEYQMAQAQRIWMWYRKCRNNRYFQARSRWLVQKVRNIQGQWRKYYRKRNFRVYIDYYRRNAIKIQSIWRRALARVHVTYMRVEMNAAALTIQRVYRGFKTRKLVRYWRGSANANAIVIQAKWRCYYARKVYKRQRAVIIYLQRMVLYAQCVKKLRQVVRGALAKHHHDTAVCIQRYFRGHRGRKRALLFRKIRNAKFARKGQNAIQAMIRRQLIQRGGAVCLQKWIRRILARRKMLKIRKWRRFAAAKCLQRYWKEWMRHLRLRRKREAQVHAAINVQRVFRGYLGRKRFYAEKHRQKCLVAAKLIQRVYRGYRGRLLYKQVHKEKTHAALLMQRAFRSRQARKFYEISQAVAALKAKEKYDNSLLGRLELKRNPMDELYRRAKIPREKMVLLQLKEKWEANRTAEERAARKLKREWLTTVLPTANDVIGNQFAVHRKLYGVTENVYATHRQYVQRQEQRVALKQELVILHQQIVMFKAAIREASISRRMLDGNEVFELLKAHGLYLDEPKYSSNQDD